MTPRLGVVGARGKRHDGLLEPPRGHRPTIADGWVDTGDVVRVYAAGRVHIIDRTKDIINSGGENVSSVEVEMRSRPRLVSLRSRWSRCRMR